MRLDLVDPEALFHHAARSVQQLFELAQREGSYLGGYTRGMAQSQSFSATLDQLTFYLTPPTLHGIILDSV